MSIPAFLGFEAWQLDAVEDRVFTAALAFRAVQFFSFFDNVPFSVADSTDHVSLPVI